MIYDIKTVWLEKHTRWQSNVQKDGKRKSFYSRKRGRVGKNECESKARAWLDGQAPDSDSRVAVLFEQYLATINDTAGSSSAHYRQYASIYKTRIAPAIGHRKLASVTEGQLQGILNSAFGDGKLAEHSLKNIRGCLSGFCKYCRAYRLTQLSTEMLVIPRGAVKGERTILQPDALRTLFSSDQTTRYGKPVFDSQIYRWRFQVATGLRPGEITGLQRSDVLDGAIRLVRAINSEGEITDGKNSNAKRSIKLSPTQSAILDDQLRYLARCGYVVPYVFPGPDGGPLPQKQALKLWHRYCEHNGLPAISLYELRHTWVSLNDAMPDGLKKRTIGHSQNMDTEGVYGHAVDSDAARAAEFAEDALRRVLAPKSENR